MPTKIGGRSGITILELLVVGSSVVLLASLLFPAIWQAHETSRNAHCVDRLQRIGGAIHTFADAHGSLPPGWTLDPSGKSGYGWAVAILPQLGETDFRSRIDLDRPIEQIDREVRATTPSVFLCPSDHGDAEFPLYAEIGVSDSHAQDSTKLLVTLPRANYMGVFGTSEPDEAPGGSGEGVFIEGRGFRFDEISRGLSRVMLVGERTTRKLSSSWLGTAMAGEDAGGRIVGCAYEGPNREGTDECEFDSRHFRHVNFVWADGHVASVEDDIDQLVYRQCSQRR